ncbi:DNA polymerase I [Collimonas arenae]|uniref:DNA polymerase I n=1 Tax=Collimonas arenae TaxID=279058 RepID=A0A0A1F6M1_9BURK|nr:DnaB-like helicase C-terminal domain-containing protein [Collimonas arenae]AIY40166.1 DNA polymerase I [Collimonas arenae]
MELLTEDMIDFEGYLAETEPQERVRSVAMYADEVIAELAPDVLGSAPKYPKMPFANCWLYFAPGEVTLWGGFNGSGKSMLQGQVLSTLAQDGHKSCTASFEMKPPKTISRMIRQHTGLRHPTPEQVRNFIQKTEKSMWVYDQQGSVHPKRLFAVIRHCAEKLGCTHIAVDSLMKCVKGTDDYNGQKEFVDQLTIIARDLNIHIHLVVHLKKGEGDEKMPTRMDISGSGAIADLVDNVVLVYRNKRKERDVDAGKTPPDDMADTLLICDKSRNGEWEGRVKLWFDPQSQKFTDFNKNARRGLARVL